jgi:hypothetical protein
MTKGQAASVFDNQQSRKHAVMIVAKRLDSVHTGSGQYLMAYLALCREQSLSLTLVFAPRRSFGNLAWSRVHPDILACVDHIDWAQSVRLGGVYISTSPKVWVGFVYRLGREAIRALRGQREISYPSKLGAELCNSEAATTVERAKQRNPEMVTVEYSSLAPLLSSFPKARRLVLLHDLFSLRAQNFIAQGMAPDHVELSLDEEARRCDDADIIIHASCTELDALQLKLPQAEHVWMRPKIPTFVTSAQRPKGVYAVFVGSKHAGNDAALAYLRRHIWPLVRQRRPDAKLHVVGTIAETVDPQDADVEGLTLVGAAPDLAAVISTNAVGLAPMNFGSGIPIKIVDYFGLGLSLVATPNAISPFGPTLENIVALGETPEHFAGHIIQLLEDENLRHAAINAAKGASKRLVNDQLSELLAK